MSITEVIRSIKYGCFISFLLIISGDIGSVQARDVDCSANMTGINFGEVDFINMEQSKSSTGNLNYHCVNNTSTIQYVNLCFYLNGGNIFSANGAPLHRMTTPDGSSLFFQLQNAYTQNVWGGSSQQLPINVGLTLSGESNIRENIPIKGSVFMDKKNLNAGHYVARFNTSSTEMMWSSSPHSTPNTCNENVNQQPFGFVSEATVNKSCKILVHDMNFGRIVTFNSQAVDAQTELHAHCTKGTEYRITLRSANNPKGQLAMISERDATTKAPYKLYQNSARTLIWAEDDNAKVSIGIGSEQKYNIYGRVEAKDIPTKTGGYQDTVIASLLY